MPSCCVTGCRATMRHGPTKTFRLPMVDNRNAIYKELSEQRQKAWLVAIHKTDADMNSYKHIAVCENHFISGNRVDNVHLTQTIYFLLKVNYFRSERCIDGYRQS